MAVKKGSKDASDRDKWQKILNNLVHMLKTQQTQLQTLVVERKLLDDRIQMMHKRWSTDVGLLQGHISQVENHMVVQQMMQSLDKAKSDLKMHWVKREGSLSKLKLDYTDKDLADFKACFDYLSPDAIEKSQPDALGTDKQNEIGRNSSTRSAKKGWEEARRLKLENETLNAKVSALIKEKDFVWNQYNVMESKLTTILEDKRREVDQANEKIRNLVLGIEKLQSSNNEKDDTIARLNDKVNTMESDTNQKNLEISKLYEELNLLRKSGSASAIPVLVRCSTRASTSSTRGRKTNNRDGSNSNAKTESSDAQVTNPAKDAEKGGRSLKRKGVEVIPICEATPKLFSATFKIPRLKTSSIKGSPSIYR